MKPATIAIHVGNEPDGKTGAVIPPIYQTSTFAASEDGKYEYDYTRAGNPNFTRLEETLAALEGGKLATVFGSGLGALTGLCSMLVPGDHIITSEDVYGGTTRLLTQVIERNGIGVTFVDAPNAGAWKKAMNGRTRLVIVESPTNPLLQIADIASIADECRRRKIICAVDNTFATPILQQPLSFGASCVWHSTTKYIGGHSDIIGGAIITDSEELKERLDFARKAMGLNPSPFDCWLAARGLKTLSVRMERHEGNAKELAQWLSDHPAVASTIYPGLKGHPQHAMAKKQMSGFGGMISVRLKASKEAAERGFSKLRLFTRAESLGGVESLISHPASQTHASLPKEERERRGIGDDLWRLSVGIEDYRDLKEDLRSALDHMT
jgi:cystathionine beta-lyase/cystathionine gamma-synthase